MKALIRIVILAIVLSVFTSAKTGTVTRIHRLNTQADFGRFFARTPRGRAMAEGIIPIIAQQNPEYARKLITSNHRYFVIVDKGLMRVFVYNRDGIPVDTFKMACAHNFGHKHEKGDNRTPEGFFSVSGIYNSTEWLFTDDEGVTSDKKGQYGPRFIRLKVPGTTEIGLHGTSAPWSLGHRATHGCVRLHNDNIMKLASMLDRGTPVIINPGRRDRAVNSEENYTSVWLNLSNSPDSILAILEDSVKVYAPNDTDVIIHRETFNQLQPSCQTTEE